MTGNLPPWLRWSPLLVLLILTALRPVALEGSGSDDFHYFEAARCWAEQGWCLPADHWQRRLAIVWPTALAIGLFGTARWALMIAPLAAAIAALALFGLIVSRRYGERIALVARLALVSTPLFSDRAMQVAIDVVEFAFLLGAIAALQSAHTSRRRWWFALAGASLALAILCRPTMFAALPMLLWLAWTIDRRGIALLLLGLMVPLGLEAFFYLAATGDPLWPWKLSLRHTAIPSDFLTGVDNAQSPLFNLAFIDAWLPAAGIQAHWTVKGLVNLLAHREIGPTLLVALAFVAAAWRRLGRFEWALVGCAALFFGALTFAFAIDPRPRMFMPVLGIACLLIAIQAEALWRQQRRLLLVLGLGAVALNGLAASYFRTDYGAVAALADRLLDRKGYRASPATMVRMAPERSHFPVAGTRVVHLTDLPCAAEAQGHRVIAEIVPRSIGRRTPRLCVLAD